MQTIRVVMLLRNSRIDTIARLQTKSGVGIVIKQTKVTLNAKKKRAKFLSAIVSDSYSYLCGCTH